MLVGSATIVDSSYSTLDEEEVSSVTFSNLFLLILLSSEMGERLLSGLFFFFFFSF